MAITGNNSRNVSTSILTFSLFIFLLTSWIKVNSLDLASDFLLPKNFYLKPFDQKISKLIKYLK
ncbi:hypothetical protein DRN73_08640 [Candidatus Pacearchaeota archaeon]|nr:MAG: hypothetical protein DRN73_08640 [Candidatus Pacearchaeota archaeon]